MAPAAQPLIPSQTESGPYPTERGAGGESPDSGKSRADSVDAVGTGGISGSAERPEATKSISSLALLRNEWQRDWLEEYHS